MVKPFSIKELFSSFHSSEIDSTELEKFIKEAIKQDNPDDEIKEIKYTKDGITVILDNDQEIDVEIDWDEIILR